MNVLLTAAGRRSYLVRYFQQALKGSGVVVVTNSEPDAPAMFAADHAIRSPPSYHPEYADAIAAICRQYEIRLLCSCHDLDVLALAPERDRLLEIGVFALLPDPAWARLCLDKYESGERLREAGFAVPWASVSLDRARAALLHGEIRFPLLVKARLGFGSLALHRCRDEDELIRLYELSTTHLQDGVVDRFLLLPARERVLVQEFIEGPELRAVVVNDLEGRYATHFVSEIHAMRAGESDSGTTLDPGTLGDLPLRLSQLTRHAGIWGIDLLVNDGVPRIIDLNPRFTGDYPFLHLAGANVPAALLAWAEGRQPEPTWLKAAAGVSGYKDLVPMRRPPRSVNGRASESQGSPGGPAQTWERHPLTANPRPSRPTETPNSRR